MKKLTLAVLLISGITISAQMPSQTEKYNSSLQRYEYYNSNGDLVAYKKYNNATGEWELYKEGTPTSYQRNRSLSADDALLKSQDEQYNAILQAVQERAQEPKYTVTQSLPQSSVQSKSYTTPPTSDGVLTKYAARIVDLDYDSYKIEREKSNLTSFNELNKSYWEYRKKFANLAQNDRLDENTAKTIESKLQEIISEMRKL